jgi:hypothetical protein
MSFLVSLKNRQSVTNWLGQKGKFAVTALDWQNVFSEMGYCLDVAFSESGLEKQSLAGWDSVRRGCCYCTGLAECF